MYLKIKQNKPKMCKSMTDPLYRKRIKSRKCEETETYYGRNRLKIMHAKNIVFISLHSKHFISRKEDTSSESNRKFSRLGPIAKSKKPSTIEKPVI